MDNEHKPDFEIRIFKTKKHSNSDNVVLIESPKKTLHIARLSHRMSKVQGKLIKIADEIKGIQDDFKDIVENGMLCDINKSRLDLQRAFDSVDSYMKILNADNSETKRSADSPATYSAEPKRTRYDFKYEDDSVVVFTDGACTNNGRSGAKAGLGVWWGVNHPLNFSAQAKDRQTNNAAEIQACTAACRIAHENGVSNLLIKTDSQFVINCMTKWIKGWMKKNWINSQNKPVINKDDLVDLLSESSKLKAVRYEYVKGHAGIEGNVAADSLATRAAEGLFV